MDLKGKVIAITGASRGLGAGLATYFLNHGAKVGICARSDMDLAARDGVLARKLDVTDGAAVEQFADAAWNELGPIDLWINNAGLLAPIAPLRDADPAQYQQTLLVNIQGVFLGSQTFVRLLRKHKHEGVLVNISSGAARNAYSGWSAYCASKAAVDRMTEALQIEEADSGLLRAYSVAPGIIDTDMQAMIRDCNEEQFPMVEKFRDLKRRDAFSSTEFVSKKMAELAFGANASHEVSISFPLEHG